MHCDVNLLILSEHILAAFWRAFRAPNAHDKFAVLVERPVFPGLEDLSQIFGESLLNQPEEESSGRNA
jgi:hypothetical protein